MLTIFDPTEAKRPYKSGQLIDKRIMMGKNNTIITVKNIPIVPMNDSVAYQTWDSDEKVKQLARYAHKNHLDSINFNFTTFLLI